MSVRVARVDGNSVTTVLGEDRCQAFLDGGERLFPGHFLKLSVLANERRAQPVRVLAKLLQPEGLGADEPLGKNIFFVPSNRLDLSVVGDLESEARRSPRKTDTYE